MDIFDQKFNDLIQVFPRKAIICKNRLRTIFDETEKYWNERTIQNNLKYVKYILIGEAPPWAEEEGIDYFYKKSSYSINTRVWKGIYPSRTKPKEDADFYNELVNANFLLVDSLPYSMKYNPINRKSGEYKNLISSLVSWWLNKINIFAIAEDAKIAFGFRINAEKIIDSTDGVLRIGHKEFAVNRDNIAADGSGNINSEYLSEIYKIRT